ncbi:spondin domain-containing protein [Echinicola jeungdonensis]|uniref:Spondin domain-containing protein n=1 Tax=Echinicola jeungdonensis TaxID=709343 RepID=A0ABV5J6L8_9BACT|nr:spondin domain-containing protein [Echinicola jeungdonensis]MDN3669288.1 spondin domain-containing protein [Echinicola jeungdonensis]
MKGLLKLLLMAIFVIAVACRPEEMPKPVTQEFTVTIENVASAFMFSNSGVFNTPVGAEMPSPIGPGGAFEFDIKAGKGEKLSFATMFAQSNDLFYGPDESGIDLFTAEGEPRSGDVTDEIILWDAGTEVNQEPGEGDQQAPRQENPGDGTDENGNVLPISMVDDGYSYPEVEEVIQVTLIPASDITFKVRIENVSNEMTLVTSMGNNALIPLSPGGWVVHTNPAPLFTTGEPERGNGLEEIAEDGNAGPMGEFLPDKTGITNILSPGAFAVHTGGKPIYDEDTPDYGEGLEAIAEDGMPGMLANSLMSKVGVNESGAFTTPLGADSPSPIGPGGSYQFSFTARQGQRLSLVTMYVQSNDLIYAFPDRGIALFENGEGLSGDLTGHISLYDAGTEINEEPGFGPNQAPRQSAPNTGPDENGNVRPVDDEYSYPVVEEVIKVTVTSN